MIPSCYTPADAARAVKKLSDGLNEVIRSSCGPVTTKEKRRLVLAKARASREALDQAKGNPARTEIEALLTDYQRRVAVATNELVGEVERIFGAEVAP
jgi:hypothetical protein